MRTSVLKRYLSRKDLETLRTIVRNHKVSESSKKFRVNETIIRADGAKVFICNDLELKSSSELHDFVTRVERINELAHKHNRGPCFSIERSIDVFLSGTFSPEKFHLWINFKELNSSIEDLKKWAA